MEIKRDNTHKSHWYVVLVNPYIEHDTKVIFGSNEQIVRNKIDKQLKKWKNKKPYAPIVIETHEGFDELPF